MREGPIRRWAGALSAAAVLHLAAAWLILGDVPGVAGGGTAGTGISLALAGGPPMSTTAQPVAPVAAAPVQPADAAPTDTEAPVEPIPPRDAEAVPVDETVPVPEPPTVPVLDERPVETVDPTEVDRSPIAPATITDVELAEAPQIDDAPTRDAVVVAPPQTPREAPEPASAIEAIVEPEARPEVAVSDTPSPDPPLAASLPPSAVAPDPPAPPVWVSEQVPLPPLPPRIPENVPERPPQPQLAQASVQPPAAPEQPAPVTSVQPVPANTAVEVSDAEQASLPPVGDAGASAVADDGGGSSGISPDAAAASAGAQASYVAALQAYLARYKRYPSLARSRNQEGVVMLYFAIDRQGALIEARIDRSSGYRQLDQAALDMVNRAAPFSPMPAEMLQSRLELVVPIQYGLN